MKKGEIDGPIWTGNGSDRKGRDSRVRCMLRYTQIEMVMDSPLLNWTVHTGVTKVTVT